MRNRASPFMPPCSAVLARLTAAGADVVHPTSCPPPFRSERSGERRLVRGWRLLVRGAKRAALTTPFHPLTIVESQVFAVARELKIFFRGSSRARGGTRAARSLQQPCRHHPQKQKWRGVFELRTNEPSSGASTGWSMPTTTAGEAQKRPAERAASSALISRHPQSRA